MFSALGLLSVFFNLLSNLIPKQHKTFLFTLSIMFMFKLMN